MANDVIQAVAVEGLKVSIERSDNGCIIDIHYDDLEAKGHVRIGCPTGGYGPGIEINGKAIGYIDLFPPSQEVPEPVQLLFFDEQKNDGEPLLKVVLDEQEGMVAVVNKDAETLNTRFFDRSSNEWVSGFPHTIHHTIDGVGDRVYHSPAKGCPNCGIIGCDLNCPQGGD